jgi:hypothetical protein
MDIRTGKFSVSPGRIVADELQAAGPESCIVLRDEEGFRINAERNLCITGTLYDQTKITPIDCVRTAETTQTLAGDGRFAMARRKPVTKAACVTLPLD